MSVPARQLDAFDRTEPLRLALRDFAALPIREALRDLPTRAEVAEVYGRIQAAWAQRGDVLATATCRDELGRRVNQEPPSPDTVTAVTGAGRPRLGNGRKRRKQW
jgi:hypothetical protein